MTDEKPTSIKFHYIKSAQFRVIHVDGMIGGLTPRAGIHIALYSERPAIPQQTVQALKEDGTLGDEVVDRRVGKEGVVREMEVDAIMDADVARALHAWLGEQLGIRDDLVAQARRPKGPMA
jgi:hypothetical protein